MAPRPTSSVHPAFTITCPTCGSRPGHLCYGGGDLPWIHPQRIAALPTCASCDGHGKLPFVAPATPEEGR